VFQVEGVKDGSGNVAGGDIRTDGGHVCDARTIRRHIRTLVIDGVGGGTRFRQQSLTPAHLFASAQHHLGYAKVGVFLDYTVLFEKTKISNKIHHFQFTRYPSVI
jgi:hypothetical protein